MVGAARSRGRFSAIVMAASLSLLVAGLMPASHWARADAASDPVVAAAGDIACDPLNGGFNGGDGTTTDCREKYTAALLPGVDKVLTLGDEQYACGGLTAFQQSYAPAWGQQKSLTAPVPGNHEYQTSGGTDCASNAAGYFSYFGAAAGDPTKGYYSFDLGSWHLIALNSECDAVACGAGSAQEAWLRADLAAHPSRCTLAYWHRPRFTSGPASQATGADAFWRDLYAAGAELVLGGHNHNYERFAPQSPDREPDPVAGIRQFVAGTGGESLDPFGADLRPNSEARIAGAFGVLLLRLRPDGYDWRFVSISGAVLDSGSAPCH